MRQNIFLHCLNRDSREIYGLFRDYSEDRHYDALVASLNAAALVCEDFCIAPPGFLIECPIAQRVIARNRVFLETGLLVCPMRDASLGDYIEKKRREYSRMRGLYGGIFDDRNVRFLADHAEGLVSRSAAIGRGIAAAWRAGPDNLSDLWMPAKRRLSGSLIEAVRGIPAQLVEEGIATTWPVIEQALPPGAEAAGRELRRILQHIYFDIYVNEFNLVVMRNLPLMLDHFNLASTNNAHDYRCLDNVLGALYLRNLLLRADAESIVMLRRHHGFIRFLDMYYSLSSTFPRRAYMDMVLSRAVQMSTFDWRALTGRWGDASLRPMVYLSERAVQEIGDALDDLCSILGASLGIEARGSTPPATVPGRSELLSVRLPGDGPTRPVGKIAVFVALEMEREVLVKRWHLARPLSGPSAMGKVGEMDVHLICAFGMGRVPAAVATMRYLYEQQSQKPDLILIAGVAGGFREEGVEQGNIIVADTVVDMATRKIRDAEEGPQTEFRRSDFTLSDAIARVLRSDAFDQPEWERAAIEEVGWPDGRRPALKHGPIASLDEVISSDQWRTSLLQAAPKLLGVEMEAGGVCAAAERLGVPVVLLRAVSDKADPSKKDDEWRRISMMTLAMLIERLDFRAALSVLRRPL